MNEDDLELSNFFRRLANALPREAAPDVERKIANGFRQRYRRIPKRLIWLAAAAAACFTTVVFMHSRQTAIDGASAIVLTPGFVALPYAQSGVPIETAMVMRVRLDSDQMSSLGVAVPAAADAAEITADLLIGQDGVPRAVRIINIRRKLS